MSGGLEIGPEESETGSGRLSLSRTKNRLHGGQITSSTGIHKNIEAKMASVIRMATKDSDMATLRRNALEAQNVGSF
jgi:hypothetical protein